MKVFIDTEKVFFCKKDNIYMVLHVPSNHTDYFTDKAVATAYAESINTQHIYTGKKSEYTTTQQGNFMKIHPLDRV